ncbi:MAG: hypothetical protein MUF15_26455 [Acidobacteria bacterium]|jgi:hypothetical protein|nr:hypothetical protein [Acidobacteriota bacterium]
MKPQSKSDDTPVKNTGIPANVIPDNILNPESSSQYYQDKKTGEWKIVNPAGSMVYNYLTRDDDLD